MLGRSLAVIIATLFIYIDFVFANTIIIDAPISPVATGTLITISWRITEKIPTNPYVLEISNIDTEISLTINNTLDLSVYYVQWVIDVEPGTYKFTIHSLDKGTNCSSGTFTVIIVSPTHTYPLNSPTSSPQISHNSPNSPSSSNSSNSSNSQNSSHSSNPQNSSNSSNSPNSPSSSNSSNSPNSPSSPSSPTNPVTHPETHPDYTEPTKPGTNNSFKSVNILGFIGITAGVIAGLMLITTGSIMIARSKKIP
ncbi:42054_t:CDS:2 [Gigaspora margarita]|uniref:42054_t:CDS:1 n=1 Tax=Gigaspora margarita TaxID=4874 RepID=A0ABM8VYF5_GIGMA|nr:42054_t:CDS:2 [Gigaspora margarita]